MGATRQSEQVNVRMPEGMRQRIKDEAARQCRTMNAEIIYQLSRAYDDGQTEKADAVA